MCSNCVPCPLCSQSTFSSIDSLRISLIKAANGPLTCPICRDVLLGLDKLTIHLFSHTSLIADSVSRMNPQLLNHEKSEKIQVKSCTNDVNAHVSFPDGSAPTLVSVSEVFTDQPRCDICGLTFATSDLLHMHNRLVHQNYGNATPIAGDAKYQCHLCAKVFKMKGSLRVHLKVVHLLGLPSAKNVPKLTICEKIRKKNEAGDVVTQGQQTPTTTISLGIQNLIDRQLTAKENELKGSPEGKARNEIPKGTESAKIWECDICAKSFTTKYFLKKHKRLHTGEMPYTCELCGKTFTFQQSYHKHLLYHSDEKPHACQTCGRAFKELSTLHNHERIHSGEKPFKCETCAKCFRQRVSYLVHKRIHTGVMPYKCQVCQKSFRYKVSQRTHKCVAQASEPTTPTTTQSEDLLQKLLQSTSILPEETHGSVPMADSGTHLEPETSEAPSLKAELSEDLLTKSIDDIVAESCNKMGIGTNCDISDLFKVENSQPRIPSPSESFQNLCLYSPSSERITSHLETINEDSLRQLLYGVEDNL